MAKPDTSNLLAEFGLGDRRPPDFFRSPSEVGDAPLNGYSHVLRQVWKSFDDILGVLSVHGRPTVYFQHQARDGPITLLEQRRFWSNGVAPILVRVTPLEVQIYSGLRPPALEGEDPDGDNRLVKVFDLAARALEMREFIRSVETGTVYQRYSKHFDPKQAVDQQLVKNLRAARELMCSGNKALDLPTIHRLLGRVLFTCYLEARGALVKKDFGRLGAGAKATFRQLLGLSDPDAVRTALKGLFRLLGRYFRGNLFDADLARDLESLRDRDIDTLRNLITGNELGSGQMVLPFEVYDFSVIPIETISAVYEDFIRAEDSEAQKKKGAYYTPPKLVEFTADLATEQEPDLTGKRVLDPGCGSGAFLVSIFNRMAEAWVRRNERARNGTRAKALAKILREQIRGVDISLVACQATCFSLYMAMLDFLDPAEIRQLPKERLPSLLRSSSEKPGQDDPQTVIHGDFLSSLPVLESQRFDLVIGNPPWVARGKYEKKSMKEWKARNPAAEYPMPAGQVACAFMWEAARYLKPDGRACLLVPAKILLGDQTDSFQAKWFSKHRVQKVAQLSDLRKFLFPGATHPAIAIRFKAGTPSAEHRVDYLTPKASHASLRDNVVTVEADDRKTLALVDILSSADKGVAAVHWLSYGWASPRDREFLSRLREFPPLSDLVGEATEKKRWIKGQGFQPYGEDAGKWQPFWGPNDRFLDANRKFEFVLAREDTEPVGSRFRKPHRVRDERVFKSPLVIFNKGFSKIAFAPFDVVFQDALQAISGPESDRKLLVFLTAVLLSPLARYFLFHLSSCSFYRYPFLNEVLRMPFPLPKDAPGSGPPEAVRAVERIFERVKRDSRFGRLGHEALVAEAKHDLTEHVYSYFDVNADEMILIEDVVQTLQKSATPSRGSNVPTLAASLPPDREQYASTLIDALHAWAGDVRTNLSATCVTSENAGVGVLTIAKARNSTKYSETTSSADLDRILSRIERISPERYGSLVHLRNLAVLEKDRIHIVKPLTMRFWLRSAALNDADAAATHLLRRRSETVTS
ncbi:MAG: N-6 DNA methylase [Planctomycetes bacterium]|nr:N-6 DNA methylase [Planctomycetota bacterium]